ncbi:MAG: ABC transporter ATP-binding protein [Cyanobacteria bacterium J083]|nr:MAG: ABC transporter ATP-binding protein [Cyanobacteria bacterium J083]
MLTGLDLHITEGERVGLIGANGAGKTTLFLTICGILSAKQGEIYVFGRKIQVGRFNPDIGLVFQNPVDQLFCPTVRDDVAFGPENLGLSPLEVNLRVQQALAVTGTSHLIDRIPHHLSGGEKSMVAIASVLSLQPKFILYDEPSANLDLQARRRLINFLQTSPQTILVASHDLEMILEVCDRVLVLNHGTIVADGQPLEIMKNRELMTNNGLEVPKSLG